MFPQLSEVLTIAPALRLSLAKHLVGAVGQSGVAVLRLPNLAVELTDILAESGERGGGGAGDGEGFRNAPNVGFQRPDLLQRLV